MSFTDILPADDPYNSTLIETVRPSDWKNPPPTGKYNFVVIGGGSAGIIAAAGAATVGAKVALIEKGYLGGDCLNYGCVPSKALIHAAREVSNIEKSGLISDVDDLKSSAFQRAMSEVRRARAEIAPQDSAAHLVEKGIDLYFGEAVFSGKNQVEVDGQTIEFSKALIATGSHPASLPIPGLSDVEYQTNETIFNLTELPRRLAIIGAGPIGVELAQAFSRLGSDVTLIDIADQILIKEDKDAAALLHKSLQDGGVTIYLNASTSMVRTASAGKVLSIQFDNTEMSLEIDEILVAAGRRPNVAGLSLESAGIEYDQSGIKVNDLLQTTNTDIFAAGDVALDLQFTHTAGHAGAIVVQNALFPFPKRAISELTIPWVTYTDPEIAQVGLTAHQATKQGVEFNTFMADMNQNDRAITENKTIGFAKVLTKKGSSTIIGATVVGENAGDIINEITIAMQHKIGLGAMGTIVRPYPTRSEIISDVSIAYNKSRLTPRVKTLFNWWFSRQRK